MTRQSNAEDGLAVEQCPVCLREPDDVGLLASGDLIYVHGTAYCLDEPADTGLVGPGVDQLKAHLEVRQ